jgi:transcriptional regulator with XRE-family HTH domain
MNSSELFSRNLRRLCVARSSIAEVCRETGINRQQFNKYLSGRGMPSARTLRRICVCLEVSESALLGVPEAGEVVIERGHNSTGQLVRDFTRLSQRFMPSLSKIPKLLPFELDIGLYNCYFPFPGYDGFLIRSLVKIWRENTQLCFTRLTRIPRTDGTSGYVVRAHHRGLVIVTSEEISLIGRNSAEPFQVSIISLDRKILFDNLHLGFTLTRSANSQIAARTVIEPIPANLKTRIALKSLGVIAITDFTVSTGVRAAMAAQVPTTGNLMSLPSRDDIFSEFLSVSV